MHCVQVAREFQSRDKTQKQVSVNLRNRNVSKIFVLKKVIRRQVNLQDRY